MYPWFVYLHIIGIFGFLLAHGASVSAAFALRRERNLERVRTLLDLSVSTYGIMYASLLVLLVAGVIGAFIGRWWGMGWIWVSLVLLIAIVGAMGSMGSRVYSEARKAAGLPYMVWGKPFPAVEASSPEELDAILSKGNPVLLTLIGYGGFAIAAWFMIFKPF
jgi:hypothetical protein